MRHELSVEDLERWEDHGAQWRLLEVAGDCAVVELCTCYGEAVDVGRGSSPALLAYVRARRADAET
jgi:hypothetical protein